MSCCFASMPLTQFLQYLTNSFQSQQNYTIFVSTVPIIRVFFLISKTQYYIWKWYKHFRFFQNFKTFVPHSSKSYICAFMNWFYFAYLQKFWVFIRISYKIITTSLIIYWIYLYIPHNFFSCFIICFLIFILTIMPAYTQSLFNRKHSIKVVMLQNIFVENLEEMKTHLYQHLKE